MTVMVRIDPNVGDAERIVVRLLRHYAACQQLGEEPLPPLTRLGGELDSGSCGGCSRQHFSTH
ncbi:hypothetical protein [Sphingobium olei]|jgi:hypothetical protein